MSRLRQNASRTTVTLLTCCLCGCFTTRPIAHGPWYDLHPVVPSAASSLIQVSINDKRPKWERNYYQGSKNPDRTGNGFTFIPIESFTPKILEKLSQELKQNLSSLNEAPERVEIDLKSFRVVLNEEGVETPPKEEFPVKFEWFDEDDDFFQTLTKAVVGGVALLGVATVAYIVPEAAHAERILPGPPKELPEAYGEDVTCELSASVQLHWSGGRQLECEVHEKAHSMSYHSSTPRRKYIPLVVERALRNTREQIKSRAEEFLLKSE